MVSAGGGLVGEPLLRAAAEAQPDAGVPMRLIGGPLLPDAAWGRLRELAGPQVELRRTVEDLGAELRGARASVSQGGYNTALEVLRSGVPGLIVPYATPEEDEQRERARRLERLGAVRVLAPERLARATLAAELRRLLELRAAPARASTSTAPAAAGACSPTSWPARARGEGGPGMSPAGRMLRPHVVAPLEGARRRRAAPRSR